MAEETVKIRVEIEVSTAATIDTGISLTEWNAMAPGDRSDVAKQIWLDEAGAHDNGGMWPVNDDAMEC